MTTNKFIHLKVRSHYSILEGSLKISDIINNAKKYKMPAVALTDNCNLFGAMEFSQAAVKAGIQPINGAIINFTLDNNLNYINKAYEITLLVMNEIGWFNLSNLISKAYLNFKNNKHKIIVLDDLDRHNDGLIAIYGDLNKNNINKDISKEESKQDLNLIKKLNSFFKDRIYLEICRTNKRTISFKEAKLLDYSYKLDIPITCTNNVYFLGEEMYEAHNALSCMNQSTTINDTNRLITNKEYYFKTSEQMEETFLDKKEALINTFNIAQRCSFLLEESKPKLPSLSENETVSEEDTLRINALKGLTSRLSVKKENSYDYNKYQKRLDYEIKVINTMGYAGYFLIVSDFILWAKKQSIPVGPGRGSGAGSIVAWALFITDLDPIKYGLLFERFLNPDRVSLPDFDIDFCKHRREEVIEYVRNKYGKNKVAQIITFGSLQPRAVIRDVGRVLGFNFARVDRIAKLIPNNPGSQVSLSSLVKEDDAIKEYIQNEPEIKNLFEISLKLEGLNRNASTHAAGIVISNQSIIEDIPLYYDSKSNIPATQFSMKYLEKIGLIKFDFLGLETLSVLDQTAKLLNNRNISVNFSKIRLDDTKTFETLEKGDTLGVFQLESLPMRQVLRELKPDRIEDIIAVVALYRPGPMENIPDYIARKHNNSLTTFPHPLLKDVLNETHGIMIYQEQVMEAARIIAGFSLAKADLLRRAMGKKIVSEMKALKESFINGSKKNEISRNDAIKIFNDIEKFAGYGFNKSHAAAYAIISYQTAWCKTNYPVEFFTSILNTEIGTVSDKVNYIKTELDRKNIKVLKSCINNSSIEFSVEKKNEELCIRSGLANIKNIGYELAKFIVIERKNNGEYLSIFDFLRRVNTSVINKRQIEFLAMSGAFDEIEKNRALLFNSASKLLMVAQSIQREELSNQQNLFSKKVNESQYVNVFDNSVQWNKNQFFISEYNSLGFFVSGNPLEEEDKFFSKFNLSNSDDISNNRINGKTFEIIGFLIKYEEKNINSTKFIDINFVDSKGSFDIRMYKEKFDELNIDLKKGISYLITANHVLDRDNRMRLRITVLRECKKLMEKKHKKSKIYIESSKAASELKSYLSRLKTGETNIILVYKDKEIFSGLSVDYNEEMFNQIKKIKGIVNIEKLI